MPPCVHGVAWNNGQSANIYFSRPLLHVPKHEVLATTPSFSAGCFFLCPSLVYPPIVILLGTHYFVVCNITGVYVGLLAGYRGLYILYWVFGTNTEPSWHQNYISTVYDRILLCSAFLQTSLYVVFLVAYTKR